MGECSLRQKLLTNGRREDWLKRWDRAGETGPKYVRTPVPAALEATPPSSATVRRNASTATATSCPARSSIGSTFCSRCRARAEPSLRRRPARRRPRFGRVSRPARRASRTRRRRRHPTRQICSRAPSSGLLSLVAAARGWRVSLARSRRSQGRPRSPRSTSPKRWRIGRRRSCWQRERARSGRFRRLAQRARGPS
jgi:hypothetical protein